MGVVWRGTDELLNRTVAVKELLGAAEPPTAAGGDALEESRQRLMREGRIGARLQHPHVISMFDVVVHDDRPWLVMEYLPSQSLAAMLTEKGPLEPRVVAEVGRQVADGLAAAHAAGVVHRDVKPGNVLIAEDGRVKLTDFGVSRAVDDVQLTRTGPDRRHARLPVARGGPGQGADGRVGRVRPGGHALRRRRGPAAVRARRERLRAAAQGRHGHRGPTAPGRPAHRAAHAAAVRRPDAAPDGVGGPRRARRHRRGPGARGRHPVDRDGPARHEPASPPRARAAHGRRRPVCPSRWPPPRHCLRHRPRRSGLRTTVPAAGTTARRPIAAARS